MDNFHDWLMKDDMLSKIVFILFSGFIFLGILAGIFYLVKHLFQRQGGILSKWADDNGMLYIKNENMEFYDLRRVLQEYFFIYDDLATERKLYDLVIGNYQGKKIKVLRYRSIRRVERVTGGVDKSIQDYNFLFFNIRHTLAGEIIHKKPRCRMFNSYIKSVFSSLKPLVDSDQYNASRHDIMEKIPMAFTTLNRFLSSGEMLFFTDNGIIYCLPEIMPYDFDKKLNRKLEIILNEMCS